MPNARSSSSPHFASASADGSSHSRPYGVSWIFPQCSASASHSFRIRTTLLFAEMMTVIAGHDPKDGTSLRDEHYDYTLAPASGKGATPEYALNYILTQNGIDPKTDVTIEWKSEVTEIIAALKTGAASIAMLPQPAATNAKNNVEGLNTALDFNDEWNKIGGDSLLVTGVTVVRKASAEAHPELVSAFLTEYEASTKYANENVAETAKLVAKYNIAAEAVALAAIPYCNISCIKGTEMKTALSAYLKTLYDENPSSVGGKMPSDSFYYNEK